MKKTGKTPKAKEALAKNARAPRGRWANTAERELIDAAKAAGRSAIPDVIKFLVDVVYCRVKRQEMVKDGDGFRLANIDPSMSDRIAASRELLDRCGMPRRTELDIDKSAFPIVVVGADWPGLASE